MCVTCVLAAYVSDDVDCRAFGAFLAFVIVVAAPSAAGKAGFFLSLKEFSWYFSGRLLCPLGVGACLLSATLFFIHRLLWKHRVVSGALNQMCVLQKRFDRKWGRGHRRRGGGRKT